MRMGRYRCVVKHIRFLFVVLWNGDWSGGRCARFSKKSKKTIAFVVIMQTHLMYGCQTIDIDDNNNHMMCVRAALVCAVVFKFMFWLFSLCQFACTDWSTDSECEPIQWHRPCASKPMFITTSSLNGNASACQQTHTHIHRCEPGQTSATRKRKMSEC